MYHLGIDGYGRYTKLLALGENNKVLGRHSGAPTDLRLQPAASVAHNMTVLVREINRLTNTALKDCAGLCFAMAAAAVKEHEGAIVRMFKTMGFTCNIQVISVERAALAAKIGNLPGILLYSGNDVAGYIWRGDGDELYAGSYGRLIETGGSAYSIGANALRRMVMAIDGRIEATALTGMITQELNLKEPSELLGFINSKDYDHKKTAALSSLVEKAGKLGDSAALEIESQAAKDLAAFGGSLITLAETRSQRPGIVLGGSVLLFNESIARQTSANLRAKFPDVQILMADEKTELGAAVLASKV